MRPDAWEAESLLRIARALGRRGRGRKAKAVPALWVFTDPARTADAVALAKTLPPETALVYRPFGAENAQAVALELVRIARARRLVLLIGADAALARRIQAAGVHLPERDLHLARRLRRGRPGWWLSGAAHGGAALARAARHGLDVAVLAKALPSGSASRGGVLGVTRTAALAGRVGLPVILLGGVTALTAHRLRRVDAVGLAMVDGAQVFSRAAPR